MENSFIWTDGVKSINPASDDPQTHTRIVTLALCLYDELFITGTHLGIF